MAKEWWPAIHLDDLWEDDMTVATIDGEQVLIVNVAGALRAYSNACPHQGSSLSDGLLEGERLTCSKHLWEFNALTGRGINPAVAHLTGFSCEARGDGIIYVELD